MNLAIDIGNSRTKLGVFDQDKLVDIDIWPEPDVTELNSYIGAKSIDNCIVANVSDHKVEGEMLEISGSVLELTHKTPLPIENLYQSPETLGKDRLAGVVGAYFRYPGQHCLIFDAGTCITIDMLTDEGKFIGGNIAPGIDMRLLSMHYLTDRLPKVEKGFSGVMLGSTTAEAIQNGAILGVLLELSGYIEMMKTKFEPLTIVMTGGDAEYLAGMLKTEIFVHPNLVLEGLNKILNFNASRT